VRPANPQRSADGVALPTTTRLGSYELIAELARGGMARVYLARRIGAGGLERLYAVKVMHEHLAEEPEALKMLVDEANIASKLHHPNVVAIVDRGVHLGNHYLVMDYVEGCSFKQLLSRNKRTRHPRLVLPIVLDALRGLHAAHELTDAAGVPQQLVHRDFSPHNLLVGTDGLCRVTDFGIAKVRDRLTHTQSRIQKGKIAYMAPEQLSGEAEVDRRVDVWAAGVVLYYALTGVHPFKADSQGATVDRILNRQVPPPSIVGLKPPECLDAVCEKALERDREARFETAAAMADEIQRLAVRHDLLASPTHVSAWVVASIEKELREVRRMIRTIDDAGAPLPGLVLPKLPGINITPTTGGSFEHTPSGSLRFEVSGVRTRPEAELDTVRLGPAVAAYPPDSGPRPGLAGPWRSTGADEVLGLAADAVVPVASPLAARSRRSRLALGVGLAVGAAALVASAFVVGRLSTRDLQPAASGPHGQSTPEQPRPAAPERTEARPNEAGATANVEPRPSGAVVRITLRDVPAGARIRLDGAEVEGPVLLLPEDGREHVIRIDLEGHNQWRRSFVPRADATYHVRLGPRRGGGGGRGRRAPSLVRDPGF